jgi:hypothetical protein
MPISFPPASQDPIIRLHDYYFQACDLMFDNTENLLLLFKNNGKLSQKKIVDLQSYLQLWLATLYVVAEGFQSKKVTTFFEKLELTDDDPDNITLRTHWHSIRHMFRQLGSELKSYRHITFHFQESSDRIKTKRASFLDYDGRHRPIDWARELHKEMRLFFGMYRSFSAALHMHKQWLMELSNPHQDV